MSDFIRRMLASTLIARAPENEGGALDPAGAPDAGGASGQPAPETPPADAGTAADGAADGGAAPSETPPDGGTPPATQPDAQQRRMNQLVAERWAERRQREEAEQRNRLLQEQLNQTRAALQQAPQVDANGNPVVPTAPTQPQAPPPDLQRMAADIAAQNDFNRQVAEEVARGRDPSRGGHLDFDQVASNLQQFGELPRTFVEAALATGKGAEVMYALGRDPLEASRILTLAPMAQAVALASLAHNIKAPVPPKIITSAPDPVTPRVGGGKTSATPSLDDPNLPVGDWIKLREKNLPKRASR